MAQEARPDRMSTEEGRSQPPAVVRGAPNWALETPTSHRLLGLLVASVAASLAVLLTNHVSPRWLRGAGDRKGKKALHISTIIVTHVQAVLTLVNGLLAFFGAGFFLSGWGGMWGDDSRARPTRPNQSKTRLHAPFI